MEKSTAEGKSGWKDVRGVAQEQKASFATSISIASIAYRSHQLVGDLHLTS